MRLHLEDLLGLPVIAITPPVVRAWHAKALRGPGGRTSISQSYRFIRSVLNVAVQDGAIVRNPCQIPGAGTQRAPERGIATPAEVAALIDATTPRFRAAVALAAWCGLRRGELCALRVTDVDLDNRRVTVRKNYVELLESPRRFEKDPKSVAGKRTVTIPPHILPLLEEHQRRSPARSTSSPTATGDRCAATPSTRRSSAPDVRSASRSRSTICGIPARAWPRRPGRAWST